MLKQIVRGPLLIPTDDGSVRLHSDGALAMDDRGGLQFAGDWAELGPRISDVPVRPSDGIMLPPLIDIHTHIPQHPIRGRFIEGVTDDAPEGKLLAGLKRNVFPAEARCSEEEYARVVAKDFLADTLSHGVVGGAAFMTVLASATHAALEILPDSWSVGLVMMNQNCPQNLRTDEAEFDADMDRLADRFGQRLIMTDRFAVAVDSPLRRRGCAIAQRHGLRAQTHLNEQVREKEFVESVLYPNSTSYTDVYRTDGLLDHNCILAHCIHMRADEWKMVIDSGSVIAHCPTSNLLLGSGVMSLDSVIEHRIPYAIATDVGASPTTSMLAEMRRFLQVHMDQSSLATPTEALWRSTLGPAKILGLEQSVGRLEKGRPASFIEVEPILPLALRGTSADDAIRAILPVDPDHPGMSVNRVTLHGKSVFERGAVHA